VSTNSKIGREPNIFGVVHSKSGKNRRNFGQETEKFSREQTFHKVYRYGFPLNGRERRCFLSAIVMPLCNNDCAVRGPAAFF
jgi:hypothetical protein